MAFTFIDLFAGIGGMRIALERAGGTCVFTSECDVACQKMYLANFGGAIHGDITQVHADDIPDHDILAGGFPCQAFSILGAKRGFADTRGTLFFEIERVLRAKRPRALLLENVRQLQTHDGGKTFATIRQRLDALGYHVHARVLNGLDFGVPQKRERIIIVGLLHDGPFEFPSGSANGKKTLADILQPETEVDKKHYLSDYMRQKRARKLQEQGKTLPRPPFVIHENKNGNLGIHFFSTALRANGSYNYVTVNACRRFTPRELLRLQGFPDSYKIVSADTQARQQAGNSVVVPKIEAVARRVAAALQ